METFTVAVCRGPPPPAWEVQALLGALLPLQRRLRTWNIPNPVTTCLTGLQPVTSLAWWVTTQSDCIRECFLLCVWECGRNRVTYSRLLTLLESYFLLRAQCFCHFKSNRLVISLYSHSPLVPSVHSDLSSTYSC